MFVKANDNVTPIEIKNGIEVVSIKNFIENSGGTLEIQEEGNTVIYKIMDKELVIKNNLSHGYINGKVVPFTYEVIKENNNELIFPDFSFDIQLIENDCLLPLQFIEKNFNMNEHYFVFWGGVSEDEIPILKRENILKIKSKKGRRRNYY